MVKAKSVRGIISLTRYKEYIGPVTIITLLGVLSSGTRIHPGLFLQLGIVLIANIFSNCFPFMYNDIEDAPDDALNPDKAKRNPLSAKTLSWRSAFAATFGVAALSLGLYSLINPLTFFLGLITILLGVFYSWRLVRFKSMPVVDLVSHSLMLGGLQFASAHFAFAPYNGLNIGWLAPFILIVTLSMYGELVNEVRDLHYDRKAGITHTAAIIGEPMTRMLMYLLLALAIGTVIFSTIIGLIPLWLIAVSTGLGILLIRPSISTIQKPNLATARNLQKPVLTVTIISVMLWIVVRSFGG